jgi:hypothetical protein
LWESPETVTDRREKMATKDKWCHKHGDGFHQNKTMMIQYLLDFNSIKEKEYAQHRDLHEPKCIF